MVDASLAERSRTPDRVIELEDEASGLRGAIVVDRLVDGVAAGGIRRARYPDVQAARREATALARAMTRKCALSELPAGGAKTVILDHGDLDVPAAYEALGRAIDDLEGAYLCGPDVGTGEDELDHVRAVTEHVNPRENDPAAATAQGVLAGLRGVLGTIDDGPATFEGSRFVVQGYGSVGRQVADRLRAEGGQVLVAEVDPVARQRARSVGHRLIDPDEATRTVCDVLVPCAMGGTLTPGVARDVPARAVCGSANEQLSDETAGQRLHERGIAYAPDVAVNAGAVIEGVLTTRHGRSPPILAEIEHRIQATEARVRELLEASRHRDRPPHEIARERALQRTEQSKEG